MRELKYVKRLLLKEWLPLIAVFLIVGVASAVISVSNFHFYETADFSTYAFTIPTTIFSVVMPFFVFSYRFSKIGGDTYYQLPFSEKKFKNLRVFTGLAAVLGVFIVSFLIGYIVLIATYYSSPEVKRVVINYWDGSVTRELIRKNINPASLLLTFVSFLVLIAGNYFITSASVSLTNRLPSAIIFTLVVQFLVGGALPCVGAYADVYHVNEDFWTRFASLTLSYSPGVFGPNAFAGAFSHGSIFSSDSVSNNLFDVIDLELTNNKYTTLVLMIAIAILNNVVVSGATFLTLYSKEPSGEYNGTSCTRNKYLNYLIHTVTIFVGLAGCQIAFSSIIAFSFFVVIYTAGLYVFLSIFSGSFKVGLVHGCIIGGSAAYLILVPIITNVIGTLCSLHIKAL